MKLRSVPFLARVTPAGGGGGSDFIASSFTAGTTSITATRPAGAGAGDYLTAICFAVDYGAGPTGSAAVATMSAPSGWTASSGLVAGTNPGATDGIGARIFTAPGDVAAMGFSSNGLGGVLIVATNRPLRAGFSFAGVDGGNDPGPNAPTGSITVTAGDLTLSMYIQSDAGIGGSMTGGVTAGFTRAYQKNDAAPWLSIAIREASPGGASGTISHGADAQYSTRFLFTGAYGT